MGIMRIRQYRRISATEKGTRLVIKVRGTVKMRVSPLAKRYSAAHSDCFAQRTSKKPMDGKKTPKIQNRIRLFP